MVQLRIALYGLGEDAWAATHYPADLPLDWRLAYLANEVRAVALPATTLLDLDMADLQALDDDLDAAFPLLLDVPATLPPEQADALLERCAALGGRLRAVRVHGTQGAALRAWPVRLAALEACGVWLLAEPASPPTAAPWRARDPAGGPPVAWLAGDDAPPHTDMAAMRAYLHHFLSAHGDATEAYLVVARRTADPAAIVRLQVLADLVADSLGTAPRSG